MGYRLGSGPADARGPFEPRPGGERLVSASYDGTVRLWDAGSEAASQTLKGHSYSAQTVAFLPDGKLLASARRAPPVSLRQRILRSTRTNQ